MIHLIYCLIISIISVSQWLSLRAEVAWPPGLASRHTPQTNTGIPSFPLLQHRLRTTLQWLLYTPHERDLQQHLDLESGLYTLHNTWTDPGPNTTTTTGPTPGPAPGVWTLHNTWTWTWTQHCNKNCNTWTWSLDSTQHLDRTWTQHHNNNWTYTWTQRIEDIKPSRTVEVTKSQ